MKVLYRRLQWQIQTPRGKENIENDKTHESDIKNYEKPRKSTNNLRRSGLRNKNWTRNLPGVPTTKTTTSLNPWKYDISLRYQEMSKVWAKPRLKNYEKPRKSTKNLRRSGLRTKNWTRNLPGVPTTKTATSLNRWKYDLSLRYVEMSKVWAKPRLKINIRFDITSYKSQHSANRTPSTFTSSATSQIT